ncbi:hypothetical protein [Natrinema soli]|uniref:Uncharacterized protein n=1 Tax=Natrinema soli TaxID=1930624 RepID=A0ABD5SQY7_9EURY|nr:hypothetical protein [Natrinema soli]
MAIKNAESANDSLEEMQRQREQEAEQRQEAMSLADEILEARERKTVSLELDDIDVEFRIMLGETRDEVEDIRTEVIELADEVEEVEDEDELDITEDEALEMVEGYRDRFIELLSEHATDDSLTQEFWIQAYGRESAGRIAMRLKEASERADMTEEELQTFRQQRNR